MKPINPTPQYVQNPSGVLRIFQSFFRCLTNGIMLATGNKQDSNGNYISFALDNGDGIMFRVGASSSSLPNKWNGSSEVVLNHNLQRQPIGFILCDLDANAVIWRAANSTQTQMTLKTSNSACNATVYIF